ncbi:hypothetical protein HC891_25850, partial [Candidatus Gracilibacteria bacterium]|nr:hypothetical protein [Candidatus Gracilibacteria bacterium]
MLANPKERHEHEVVVRIIRQALADRCTAIEAAPVPTLMKMRNLQHLYTPVTARVIGNTSVLALVERLHPTPAVGGWPRDASLQFIREHEELDRGVVRWPDRLAERRRGGRVRGCTALGAGGRGHCDAVCRLRDRRRLSASKRVPRNLVETATDAERLTHTDGSFVVDGNEQINLGRFVGALIDGLVQSGARQFVICPGSRSTPLALTIAQHRGATYTVLIDERSAAFYALGMARVLGEPVVLVCTSGTAAANFLPALAEAQLARIPLIVLTADRPHELRDNGAPQTIDQLG